MHRLPTTVRYKPKKISFFPFEIFPDGYRKNTIGNEDIKRSSVETRGKADASIKFGYNNKKEKKLF